jgi:hypothetical protein
MTPEAVINTIVIRHQYHRDQADALIPTVRLAHRRVWQRLVLAEVRPAATALAPPHQSTRRR